MSKFFRLNTQDLLKGMIVTVIGSVLTSVIELLKVGSSFDWQTVLLAGAIAGLSYMAKNLATDQEGKFMGKL